MDQYFILSCEPQGAFQDRIIQLHQNLLEYLSKEKSEGRMLHHCKIFLSDAQNQYQQLIESELYQDILSKSACTIVEQTPLNGSKLSILVKTSDSKVPFLFHSLRLTEEEANCNNSYLETMMLFEKYIKIIKELGLNLKQHCVRTWIYVSDIDNNYGGVVKARNDIFQRYGLSIDTHFIASTGIGGNSHIRNAFVAMDFLTFPDIEEHDKVYLKALDHLSPTHEYGVSFERGTRLTLPDKKVYYISGTASIDKYGHVIYLGNLKKQTDRLLENIEALLHEGGSSLDDVCYYIIYLRDISDYQATEEYMKKNFPTIPYIIVHAKVCRPEWLIEMECVAVKEN